MPKSMKFEAPSSLEAASATGGSPAYQSFLEIPGISENVSVLRNPYATENQQKQAYDNLYNMSKNLFIDADTIRGDIFGLDGNIRLEGFDAIEDTLKNQGLPTAALMKKKMDERVGHVATESAIQSFIGSLVSGEDTGLYLEGKVDRPGATQREIGQIIQKDQEGYIEPVKRDLIDTHQALSLAAKDVGIDRVMDTQEARSHQIASAFNAQRGAERGSLENERFEALKKKYGVKSFDDMLETGALTSPLDIPSAILGGADTLGANIFGALERLTRDVPYINDAMKWMYEDLQKQSKKRWQEVRNKGLYNDILVKDYGLDKAQALWYQDKYMPLVREGLVGIFEGAAEMAASKNPYLFTLGSAAKADELARNRYGDKYTLEQYLGVMPEALGYMGLNKVEADTVLGKYGRAITSAGGKTLGKKLMAFPAGVAVSSMVEGGAEALQTFIEERMPNEYIPTEETQQKMKSAGILGAFGGGPASGVTSTGSIVSTAGTKAKEKYEDIKAKSAQAEAEETVKDSMIEYSDAIDKEAKESGIKPEDLLHREGQEAYIENLRDRLKSKKERLAKGTTAAGVKYKPETIEKMKQEIATLEKEIASYEKDAPSYFHNKFLNSTIKRISKSSDQSLADMAGARQAKLDSLNAFEKKAGKLTEKQQSFKRVLEDELKLIDEEMQRRGSKAKPETSQEPQPAEKPAEKKGFISEGPVQTISVSELEEEEPVEQPQEEPEAKPVVEPIRITDNMREADRYSAELYNSLIDKSDKAVRDTYERLMKKYNDLARKAVSENDMKKLSLVSSDMAHVENLASKRGIKLPRKKLEQTVSEKDAVAEMKKARDKAIKEGDRETAMVKDFFMRNWGGKTPKEIGEYIAKTKPGIFDEYYKAVSRTLTDEALKEFKEGFDSFVSKPAQPETKQEPQRAGSEKETTGELIRKSLEERPRKQIAGIFENISNLKDFAKGLDQLSDAMKRGIYRFKSKVEESVYLSGEHYRADIAEEILYRVANGKPVIGKDDDAGYKEAAEKMILQRPGILLFSGIKPDRNQGWAHPIVSAVLMSNTVSSILNMSSMLKTANNETIAALFNIDPKNKKAIEQHRKMGIPRAALAERIGNDVIDALGIKMPVFDEASIRSQMAKHIGLIGLSSLQALGSETENIVSFSTKEALGRNQSYVTIENEGLLKNINDEILETKLVKSLNVPHLEKPGTKKRYGMKRKSEYEATKAQTDYMNLISQTPIKKDDDFIEFFETLPENAKRSVLTIKNKVHPLFKENNDARTEAILNAYREAKAFFDEAGTKPFYYTAFMGGNGRINIEQTVANPQSDKQYTRYMILWGGSRKRITKKNIGAFKSAVVLALGGKPEHETNIDEAFDRYVSDIEERYPELLKELAKKNPSEKALKDAASLAGSEEGMYTLKALRELARAKSIERMTGTMNGYETSLPLEVDGITNGLAFLTQQAGVTNEEIRNMVGIFTKEDGSVAKRISNGGLDAYNYIANIAKSKIFDNIRNGKYDKRQEAIANDFTSLSLIGRSAAKTPVMTFLYGMGLAGIKRELSKYFATEILDKTINGTKAEKQAANDIINRALNTKGVDYSQEGKMNEERFDDLQKGIAFLTDPFADSLEQGFPEISSYRKMAQAGGTILYHLFDYYLQNGKNEELRTALIRYYHGTREEVLKAKEVLKKYVPHITMPGNPQSTRPLVKFKKRVVDTGTSAATEKDLLRRYTIRFKKNNTNFSAGPNILQTEDSSTAVAVVPIHNLDSETAMRSHMDTYRATGAVGLNIHDAGVFDIDSITNWGQNYNRNFLEVNEGIKVADQIEAEIHRMRELLGNEMFEKVMKQEIKDGITLEMVYRDYSSNAAFVKANIAQQNRPGSIGQMNGVPDVEYKPANDTLAYGRKRSTKNANQPKLVTDLKEILDSLGKESPLYDYYAKMVDAIGPAIGNAVKVSMNKKRGLSADGLYDRKSKTLYLWVGRNHADAQEAYVHEIIHAVTETAIEMDYSLQREILNLADKMSWVIRNSDMPIKKKERYLKAIAQAPEHELLPWFLTDPELIALAKKTPIHLGKPKNLWERILLTFERIVNTIRRITGKSASENELYHMQRLLSKAVTITRRHNYPSKWKRASDIISRDIEKVDSALAEAVERKTTLGRGYSGMSTVFGVATRKASDFVKEYAGFDLVNSETLNSVKHSIFKTKGKLADMMDKISAEYTTKINNKAMNIEMATDDLVNEAVGSLSKEDRAELKRWIIDTDMTLFMELGYDYSEIRSIVQNPDAFIESKWNQLRDVHDGLTKEQENELDYAADILAHFMITGETVSGVFFTNARQIVDFTLPNINPQHKEAAVRIVDEMVSAKAMKMKGESKKVILDMLQNPLVGNIFMPLAETRVTARKHLFPGDQRYNEIKGYSKNSFKNEKEYRFIPKDAPEYEMLLKDLKDAGFKIVDDSNKYYTLLVAPTPSPAYQQGFVSISDYTARGYMEPIDLTDWNKAVKQFRYESKHGGFKALKKAQENGIDIYRPAMFFKGGQPYQRIVMTKSRMRELFGLNEDIAIAASTTAGHVLRKANSMKLNRKLVDLMIQDYQEADPESRKHHYDRIVLPPVWTGDYTAYKLQKAAYENQPKKMKEIADMLPKNTIQHALQNGRTELYVRKELRPILFGYREFVPQIPESINVFGQKVKLSKWMRNGKVNGVLRIVDYYFRAFVEVAKKRIVLYNPMVHAGNMVSNIMLLKMNGLTSGEIYSYMKEAYNGIMQYKKDIRSYTKLHLKGLGNTKRGKELLRRINNNPVKESIDAGLFSFIVEDVTSEVIQKQNPIEKNVQKIIDSVGSKISLYSKERLGKQDEIVNIVKNVYGTDSTDIGKGLTMALQLSDFMAKHAIYRKYKGTLGSDEAVKLANDLFIDYSMNESKLLHTLNKYFLFPFNKFAIRIQRGIVRTAVDHPLYFMMMAVGVDMADELGFSYGKAENVIYNNFGTGMFNNLHLGPDPMMIAETPYSIIFE